MMKIGIVTYSCNLNNFGATMQALALQRVLESFGYEVKHIMPNSVFPVPKDEKEAKSLAFNKRNLNYLDPSSKNELNELDLIVCGSDQIWSYPLNKLKAHYFGSFANLTNKKVERISYAASLGKTDLTDSKIRSTFNKFLKEFSHISLRENQSVGVLSELTGKPVDSVLDPSMLLTRYEYSSMLSSNPFVDDYIYIHNHWHNCPPENQRFKELVNYAELISSLLNLKIVHNLDYTFNNQLGTTRYMNQGEVVNVISHAKFVLTDSFHGTVFAIIFGKEFLAIKHNDARDDRLITMLDSMGLIDRLTNGKNQLPIQTIISDINWLEVSSKMNKMKQHSLEFLFSALGDISKRKEKHTDYITTANEFNCYGCGACKDICAHNAIMMKQNTEGFWFPIIDFSTCVKCDICKNTCSHNSKPKLSNYDPKAYISYALDTEIQINASSGGLFMVFANSIIAQGGYVIGVKFATVTKAIYDIADTIESVKEFRYSKYVEPEDNDILSKTREALETGKPVFFTGTACKLSGLHAYLKKEYENLYTMEILCKGYPSSLVLNKYINLKENVKKSKISKIQFRSSLRSQATAATEIHFEDGSLEIIDWTSKNSYIRAFRKGWSLRKSCYRCDYKMNNYISDITVGDAWGLDTLVAQNDPQGLSVLKINTMKGKSLLDQIETDIYLKEIPIKDMYRKNVNKPVAWNKERSTFFNDLTKMNIQKVVELYWARQTLEKKK